MKNELNFDGQNVKIFRCAGFKYINYDENTHQNGNNYMKDSNVRNLSVYRTIIMPILARYTVSISETKKFRGSRGGPGNFFILGGGWPQRGGLDIFFILGGG